MIGYLGSTVFEVSGRRVRTFSALKRSGSSRIASHDLIGGKQLLEFTGPGLESIALNITFSSYLGVAPLGEVETLRSARDEGRAIPLVLDGTPQGSGLWLIESLSEDWKYVDNNGSPRIIECAVTLKEYAR